MKSNRMIGLVGGMGPQAGLDLFHSILSHTDAAVDQDHLSVILMSFPGEVADRTAFLEGKVLENPGYAIAGIIRRLEKAGAALAGIACNTSHAPAIFNVIGEELARSRSRIRLLNMPEETCLQIKELYPSARRVGVLATNGTCRSGVYTGWLQELGYEVVQPDAGFQNEVIHRMIYDPVFGLKANAAGVDERAARMADMALQYFSERDVEVVILGCTDLSQLRLGRQTRNMLILDSNDCMARALIRETTIPKTTWV